jgi:hypothetical protein
MSIDGDRQLTQFVPERLPEFVRVDHPTLVAFMSAYYEWLGLRRNEGKIVSPLDMRDITDIDHTLDQFVDQFKSEFLLNFPESLALDPATGNGVDPRRLIKNIRQFYLAKGTEKSYEFLFRILYDTSVEFYYPKTDILRLSSGRWTQNNYLRISNSLGDSIFRAAGNNIVQRNARGQVLATARCVDASVYQAGNFDVAELLISNRNGTFQAGTLGIEFTDGTETFREVKVYSLVSAVTIGNGGSDYQVSERLVFTPAGGDSGQRATGTVTEVDSIGSVRKVSIDDFGINYESVPSVSIVSSKGTGFSGTVSIGALAQSAGFYANNDGRLSTNKVLQDNHFFQNWSYVLKSEVVIDRYREIVRRLVHPVGTAMFGSILIKRCAHADLANASTLVSYEVPIIGHYTPYTFQTFDDLSTWFMTGVTGGLTAAGYNPSLHDPSITAAGDGYAVIGNPISNNIPFGATSDGLLGLTGFQNADPFWIIYEHPNRKVSRENHIAKIWNTQLSDFQNWGEWSFKRDSDGQVRMDEWVATLAGTTASDGTENACCGSCCRGELYREPYDFKYALLRYDENSEFRKLTARSFFTMKTGQEFDCREESFVSPALPQFSMISPISGATVNNPTVPSGTAPVDYGFFRNLTVRFDVSDEANLSLPQIGAAQIRASLDNRTTVTASLNARAISFSNLTDGLHTLRLEFIDSMGRLVSGTQTVVIFGYQFVPPS